MTTEKKYKPRPFRRHIRTIAILSIIGNCNPIYANSFSVSAGFDFTSGKYGGSSTTDIWYVPFTGRYDYKDLSFRIIVPYLDLTGPGNILGPGIGGINIGDGGIIPGIIGGSLGGGGIFICDENNGDCAPTDDDSDPDDDNNSGSDDDDPDPDDNSGSGSDDDDSDPDDNSGSGSDDDDSGPDDNSGSGSDDDDSDPDDNSGSGSDDDDSDPDDSSGSGSDDDDSDPDDNSGSGSDDDDPDPDDSSGSGSNDDAADDDDEINVLTFNENDIHILTSALNQTGIVQNTGPSHFSHSGLGDIVTALTYNVITHESTGIIFDITGRMKIPTASTARNLGTGKFDFAVQGDLVKTISRFMLSASFGYRMLGNPQGIDLHNVFYGATGIAFRFTPDTTIGASFNIGQSPVRRQDSRDFTLYMSYRLNKNFRLNAYGLRGASERSPDWGGGISLRYAF
jgi:hypothetical protein